MSDRSAPSLRGQMRLSPLYQTLGQGFTDRIFLVGHADGLALNDPYQVGSVQDAINILGADSDCPLLRGLVESYYSGARDIWLIAAAPMSEYVAELSDRLNPLPDATPSATYWERYAERLATTYALLLEWDLPKYLVPLEVSLTGTGGVDFLTPLANHCSEAFDRTGVIRLGLMGNRGKVDEAMIQELMVDDRLDNLGEAGRFVAVLLGEVLLLLREMPTTYNTSVAATAAGELSNLKLDRGLTYHRFQNAIRPTHADLSAAQIEQLAQRGLNVLMRTVLGRRGTPFQTVLATDNTLAQVGSDFWSLTQMRLVAVVLDELRSIGLSYVGSIAYPQFRSEVAQYFQAMQANDIIRGYEVDIGLDPFDRSRCTVNAVLRPYCGVRELVFTSTVGPSGSAVIGA